MKNIIAATKSRNIENFQKLKERDKDNEWYRIDNKADLTSKKVAEINPRYIFVPHWNWRIPNEIVNDYETIIFHTADLPYGRGGSPIQNHILRGIYSTKITALKATGEMDAGPVYIKRDFDLSEGNVGEILTRISDIIFNDMIPYIVTNKPDPKPQKGKIVVFKRRIPEDSDLSHLINPTQRQLYDYIRMLDGEGYPKAYLKLGNLKMEFSKASLEDKCLRVEMEIKLK